MRKNNCLILSVFAWVGLVASGQEVRAQADFRSGYVVRAAGDTLRGLVDRREARLNATRCRFRPDATGAIATYTPADVLAYGYAVPKEDYRTLAVLGPPPAPGPASAAAPSFLLVLADGPAQLYYLRAEDGQDRYYVASPALPLSELVHRTVLVERDGKTYYDEQHTYRATLAQALPNCPAAQSMLPTLAFGERPLVRSVARYNACAAPAAGHVAPAAPPGVDAGRPTVGLLVGVQQGRLTINTGDALSTDSEAATGPVVGLALAVPFSRHSRKLSLQVNVFYETQQYALTGKSPVYSSVGITTTAYKFDLAGLRAPVLLRYTLPNGHVHPFAEAGGAVAYAFKTNNSAQDINSSGGTGSPRPVFGTDGFRRLELGLTGGVGLAAPVWQGRNLNLLVRYERSDGYSGVGGIATPITRIYGLLILELFK